MTAGLILLYHRITGLSSDPQLLGVTPSNFSQHLDVLRDHGRPMPLAEMIAASRDRRLPRRAVAVTFDDGYADTFDCGEPLLASHDVPATVFVTTSYVGGDREFWWDDLERLLLRPDDHPDWNVECQDDPSPRHRIYRDCCRLLRAASREDRRATLDELARTSGLGLVGRSTHRAVSGERLARASESGLIDVGAHSVTHPALSARSGPEQRSEIAESRASLLEITGREPAGFSYPFGGRGDYTLTTVGLVQEAGFVFACANIPGNLGAETDRFQLPRMLVRDWDGDTFAARLREWFGD